MKITSAGQVSVPAAVRRRWATTHVRIVDAGDHLVVEPESDNPFEALRGALGPLRLSVDEVRRLAREDDEAAETRRAR